VNADPRAVVTPETASMWQGLSAQYVRITAAEDVTGELTTWFARHNANLAVVRPDKIIFGACDTNRPGSAAKLAEQLRAALNAPVERIPRGGRRLSQRVPAIDDAKLPRPSSGHASHR
jgi:hypothetical protein